MPRNNKFKRKPQQSKPWSGSPVRPRQEDAGGGERAVRRGQARGNRRLSVRSELRQEPDVRRIARAVIELAMAQAEADAASTREATPAQNKPQGKEGLS